MADRIDIDPRLILPWTTGTQYRIAVTQGLVIEDGNNRSPSPAIGNSKTFTTFSEGPTVASTSPPSGTTTVANTATLSYNRPLFQTTGTNFYLYRETTGSNILVATIPSTSTRITQVGKNVTISFRDLLTPNFKHYLTADAGIYKDLFNFSSVAITTSTIFNYVPGPGADVLTVVPAFGQTNQFHNTVNITYNKSISRVNTGNYYLNYNSSGTVRTFAVSSSSIVVNSTGSSVQISFADSILPEGEYFITNDGGIFTDQHNFPYPEVYDASEIKWFNTSISNMGTLRYRGETPSTVFTTTNPRVLDIDLNTATQYTFTLEAPIGEFSSPLGGTDAGSYWTFTGTKTQINNLIESIIFTTNSQENPPSTYTYSLSKNGVTLVNKTNDFLGILLLLGAPGPTGKAFPRLNLSLSGTNVIDETLTLTANISTSTTLAGLVEFKSDNVVISTATISSGGIASITTTFPSTGTRFLSASWLGGVLPTDGFRYEPLDSFDTQINIAAAQRLPSDPVIGFTNLTTLRVPVGPDVEIRGTLPISGLGGLITFNQITEVTTATTTPAPVNITIQGVSVLGINFAPAGPYQSTEAWAITVNTTSTIAVGEWLKITGTMTGLGLISGLYRVSRIVGSAIYFDARSESDNLYYWYDPLKDFLTVGVTVSLNPIQYISNVSSTGTLRTSASAIGTSTVVGSTALLTTSFTTTGTYLLSADWSGRVTAPKYFPQVSGSTQLIVTDRADYPVPLVLTGPTYIHQLKSTEFNFVNNFSTATTGTISFSSFNSISANLINSVPFNTSTITFPVLANSLPIGTNKFRADWDGQAWTPNEYFPYYSTSTNEINITYQLGQLNVSSPAASFNTIVRENQFTAIANTSSADSSTISFYDGDVLLLTTATNNNSATITISSGTLAAGNHNIYAIWNDSSPLVVSPIFNSTIVNRGNPNPIVTLSTSSYVLFNQDNTLNTSTISANVRLTGQYSEYAPTGNFRLKDQFIDPLTASSVSSVVGNINTATVAWNPGALAQTIGVKQITVDYAGDDWYTNSSATTSLSLVKPVPSFNILLSGRSYTSRFYNPIFNRDDVYTGLAAVGPITYQITKPTNTTLTATVKLYHSPPGTTSTHWLIGETNFVGNTATIVNNFTTGTVSTKFFAVYDETEYHLRSQAVSADTNIARIDPSYSIQVSNLVDDSSYTWPNGQTGKVLVVGENIRVSVTTTSTTFPDNVARTFTVRSRWLGTGRAINVIPNIYQGGYDRVHPLTDFLYFTTSTQTYSEIVVPVPTQIEPGVNALQLSRGLRDPFDNNLIFDTRGGIPGPTYSEPNNTYWVDGPDERAKTPLFWKTDTQPTSISYTGGANFIWTVQYVFNHGNVLGTVNETVYTTIDGNPNRQRQLLSTQQGGVQLCPSAAQGRYFINPVWGNNSRSRSQQVVSTGTNWWLRTDKNLSITNLRTGASVSVDNTTATNLNSIATNNAVDVSQYGLNLISFKMLSDRGNSQGEYVHPIETIYQFRNWPGIGNDPEYYTTVNFKTTFRESGNDDTLPESYPLFLSTSNTPIRGWVGTSIRINEDPTTNTNPNNVFVRRYMVATGWQSLLTHLGIPATALTSEGPQAATGNSETALGLTTATSRIWTLPYYQGSLNNGTFTINSPIAESGKTTYTNSGTFTLTVDQGSGAPTPYYAIVKKLPNGTYRFADSVKTQIENNTTQTAISSVGRTITHSWHDQNNLGTNVEYRLCAYYPSSLPFYYNLFYYTGLSFNLISQNQT